MAHDRGDLALAEAQYAQGLALARHLNDKRISARALRGLGNVTRAQGDVARAAALSEQSLSLAREVGDLEGSADVLCDLAEAALLQGESTQALALFQEALSHYRAVENHLDAAWTLVDLGRLARLQGDNAEALAYYGESLALFRDLGKSKGIAHCLETVAGIVGVMGQPERAARLLAAAAALRDAGDAPLSAGDRAELVRTAVASARAQLGAAGFAAAWVEGRALSPGQAIALRASSHNAEGIPEGYGEALIGGG